MRLLFSICILTMVSCSSKNIEQKGPDEPIAVQMADAVMSRHDSLVYYNNPSKVKWQYDIAMLGQAIDRLGDLDPEYSIYMKDFIDYFVQDDGSVLKYKQSDYNLDHINPARNLITLYKRTGDEKYLLAIRQFITQLEHQPRTPSGGFWHKKRYPNQMWLDGIYMSGPFMAQYAAEFNQPGWFDTLTYQIVLIYNKTLDPETGLLYHAWDESKSEKWCNPETGQSKHFWSRAMGWYMMALVDVLDYLPRTHERRDTLISILNHTSAALMKVRDKETKLWYQVLDEGDREGNYLEASGSSMFVYAFAKGVNKGYLPERYREYAEESFRAIEDRFIYRDKDGLLHMQHICGGCGLGGDPYRDGSYTYYIMEEQVTDDPKGVAPFIMAAIELNQEN